MIDPKTIAKSLVRVGGGRGFVVVGRNGIQQNRRYIITVAHCLPTDRLQKLVKELPYTEESGTFPKILVPPASAGVRLKRGAVHDPRGAAGAKNKMMHSRIGEPAVAFGSAGVLARLQESLEFALQRTAYRFLHTPHLQVLYTSRLNVQYRGSVILVR